MFYIAICDDSSADRERIRLALEEETASLDEGVGFFEYESGKELLASWGNEGSRAGLVFLDIYMKEIDGMETARRLREAGNGAEIVFLTETPDFAMEGYEVEAAGYLLKPFQREKLQNLLRRLLVKRNEKRLVLQKGNSVVTVAPSEIFYVESDRNQLKIHTTRETIPYYGRLSELEGRLSDQPFLRCHQSYLVNMDRVRSAENDFFMENGEIVPIRVRERKAIRDRYFRYIMEKHL